MVIYFSIFPSSATTVTWYSEVTSSHILISLLPTWSFVGKPLQKLFSRINFILQTSFLSHHTLTFLDFLFTIFSYQHIVWKQPCFPLFHISSITIKNNMSKEHFLISKLFSQETTNHSPYLQTCNCNHICRLL